MKTGMNLLLWTGHVTDEHFPLLGKLKAAGFDGVELPIFEGRRRPLQEAPGRARPDRAEVHDRHHRHPGGEPDQPRRGGSPGGDRAAEVGDRLQPRARQRGDVRAVPLGAGRVQRRAARPATRRSGPPTCSGRPRSTPRRRT